MQRFYRATHVTLTAATIIFVVAACGKAKLNGQGNKNTNGVQLGGDSAGNCLKLGDADPAANSPAQGYVKGDVKGAPVPAPAPATIVDKGGKGGVDVVVVPPKAPINEPPPAGHCNPPTPTPSQPPTQTPPPPPPVVKGPINNPGQFPSQMPSDANCGKGSLYCGGGPGQAPQWPGQAVGGGSYNRDDVAACMGAFQAAGYNVSGGWNIDVRSSLNVNVLSGGVFDDHSTDHAVIIVKSVSVLGAMHFNLLNPNALYCLKDVSVLEQVSVTSCYQSNVVSLKDVAVLSTKNIDVVDCARK